MASMVYAAFILFCIVIIITQVAFIASYVWNEMTGTHDVISDIVIATDRASLECAMYVNGGMVPHEDYAAAFREHTLGEHSCEFKYVVAELSEGWPDKLCDLSVWREE